MKRRERGTGVSVKQDRLFFLHLYANPESETIEQEFIAGESDDHLMVLKCIATAEANGDIDKALFLRKF